MKTWLLCCIILLRCADSSFGEMNENELSIQSLTNKKVLLTWPGEAGKTYNLLQSSDPAFLNQVTVTNALVDTNTAMVAAVVSTISRTAYFKFQTQMNPLYNLPLFVNPNGFAEKQLEVWGTNEPTKSQLLHKIADQPQAYWLTGKEGDVSNTVARVYLSAEAAHTIPVFVVYNIPKRDCSSYSGGGATHAQAYLEWCTNLANALPYGKSIVILEPDALSLMDCLSQDEQDMRIDLIWRACFMLKDTAHAIVYIDAGHSDWQSPTVMAERLFRAGLLLADGFSLNVSNFKRTADEIRYGMQLSKLTHNSHFVIDTSRNGLGEVTDPSLTNAWCNPPGRALGERPTTDTCYPLVDAFLWIKNPGESDGACHPGDPDAGTWWLEYALDLAERAAY